MMEDVPLHIFLMVSFGDFQGLKSAIELRGALEQVNFRSPNSAVPGSRSAAEMIGLNPLKGEGMRLPIFDDTGSKFAGNQVAGSKSLYTSGSVKEGELIEFESNSGNKSYGVVIEPPFLVSKKGVYVRNLSKEEYTALAGQNSSVTIHINEKALGEAKQENSVKPSLSRVAFLDPVGRFFLGVFKEALLFTQKAYEIAVENWLWIYMCILLLLLAAIIVTFSENGLRSFIVLFE